MPRLTAWRAPRPLRPPRWTRTRRIARWRPRGVARVAGKLPLELVDPRRQPLNLPPQPLVLRRKLKQNTHNRLTARVVDRLRLTPIHTPRFDAAELCPPDQLNAYKIPALCGGFPSDASAVLIAWPRPSSRGLTQKEGHGGTRWPVGQGRIVRMRGATRRGRSKPHIAQLFQREPVS